MLLRKALVAALVVAPFVYSPSAASAQSGLDRAADRTAHADEVGAGQRSHAHQEMPRGIAKRFGDDRLPPGIRRTRHSETPPPPPPPEEETPVTDTTGDTGGGDPPPDPTPVCLNWITVVSGFSVTQQCTLWSTP